MEKIIRKNPIGRGMGGSAFDKTEPDLGRNILPPVVGKETPNHISSLAFP